MNELDSRVCFDALSTLQNLQMVENVCNVCGASHFTQNCPDVSKGEHIQDTPHQNMSRSSIPNGLHIIETGESLCVVTSQKFAKGTRFGPLMAKKSYIPVENAKFPLIVFGSPLLDSNDAEIEELFKIRNAYLDTRNENYCNWMIHVSPAQYSNEQNLICYQLYDQIFYTAIVDIEVGDILKVWYAPKYAAKMNVELLKPSPHEIVNNILRQVSIASMGSLTDDNLNFENNDYPVYEDITEKNNSEISLPPINSLIKASSYQNNNYLCSEHHIYDMDKNYEISSTSSIPAAMDAVAQNPPMMVADLNYSLVPGFDGDGQRPDQLTYDKWKSGFEVRVSQGNGKLGSKKVSKYLCEVCDKEYMTLANINKHMRSHNLHLCNLCVKSFKSTNELREHVCPKEKDVTNYSKCPVCFKILSNSWSLSRHMKTHKRDEAGNGEDGKKATPTTDAEESNPSDDVMAKNPRVVLERLQIAMPDDEQSCDDPNSRSCDERSVSSNLVPYFEGDDAASRNAGSGAGAELMEPWERAEGEFSSSLEGEEDFSPHQRDLLDMEMGKCLDGGLNGATEKCTVCGKQFKNRTYLYKHLKQVHTAKIMRPPLQKPPHMQHPGGGGGYLTNPSSGGKLEACGPQMHGNTDFMTTSSPVKPAIAKALASKLTSKKKNKKLGDDDISPACGNSPRSPLTPNSELLAGDYMVPFSNANQININTSGNSITIISNVTYCNTHEGVVNPQGGPTQERGPPPPQPQTHGTGNGGQFYHHGVPPPLPQVQQPPAGAVKVEPQVTKVEHVDGVLTEKIMSSGGDDRSTSPATFIIQKVKKEVVVSEVTQNDELSHIKDSEMLYPQPPPPSMMPQQPPQVPPVSMGMPQMGVPQQQQQQQHQQQHPHQQQHLPQRDDLLEHHRDSMEDTEGAFDELKDEEEQMESQGNSSDTPENLPGGGETPTHATDLMSTEVLSPKTEESLPEAKIFTCDECNKIFAKRSQLTRHKNIHKNILFICPFCQREPFKARNSLKNHLKTNHKDMREKWADPAYISAQVIKDPDKVEEYLRQWHEKTKSVIAQESLNAGNDVSLSPPNAAPTLADIKMLKKKKKMLLKAAGQAAKMEPESTKMMADVKMEQEEMFTQAPPVNQMMKQNPMMPPTNPMQGGPMMPQQQQQQPQYQQPPMQQQQPQQYGNHPYQQQNMMGMNHTQMHHQQHHPMQQQQHYGPTGAGPSGPPGMMQPQQQQQQFQQPQMMSPPPMCGPMGTSPVRSNMQSPPMSPHPSQHHYYPMAPAGGMNGGGGHHPPGGGRMMNNFPVNSVQQQPPQQSMRGPPPLVAAHHPGQQQQPGQYPPPQHQAQMQSQPMYQQPGQPNNCYAPQQYMNHHQMGPQQAQHGSYEMMQQQQQHQQHPSKRPRLYPPPGQAAPPPQHNPYAGMMNQQPMQHHHPYMHHHQAPAGPQVAPPNPHQQQQQQQQQQAPQTGQVVRGNFS
ncbi:uncharacterized protein LOC129795717 isoform X1 [Lutzomyia longipalpis]|uniref:uncharacterized protein LOC129795717 isoform X1 n=1 Tax=Lutzomyia longipalpis TaxID=7200 RepID=UPI0024834BF2|nr:uncharacterized protein LOC129795717 isoform X1 [Lutzomyia longipalpis]